MLPFCRTSHVILSQNEYVLRCKKRMDLNDHHAYHSLASAYFRGSYCLPRNKKKAIDLWKQSANLGSREAHSFLSHVYLFGEGVKKDKKMAEYHCKLAAIGGHKGCRNMLGNIEKKAGNMDRSMKDV